MDLRPDEITGIIKSRIKDYGSKIRLEDTGTVVTVGDGIVRIHGLEKCMMNELLEFENGVRCMALNLEQDFVGAVMLGSDAATCGNWLSSWGCCKAMMAMACCMHAGKLRPFCARIWARGKKLCKSLE